MDVDFREQVLQITQEERDRIRELHKAAAGVVTLIDMMAAFKVSSHIPEVSGAADEALKVLNASLEKLELEMQKNWHIPQDANYHTWWLRPSLCDCPRMDNMDPLQFGAGKIISSSCPVHSHVPKGGEDA